RTHFTFPTNPVGAVLYMTNVVDDGCIVYLNGIEMYRIRMPGGTVASNTPASGTGTEGAQELQIVINSPRLRQGDNVIAVELHDTVGSSDVDWTMGLAYRLMSPIAITTQPINRIDAQIGDSIEMSVEVSGDDPRYWWFRSNNVSNVFLTGQTNSLLRLSNIQTNQAGTYYVIVSNVISGVRSSNTVVTVVPDIFPPEFVSVVINEGDSNRVFALFDEDILSANNRTPALSGTNLANYYLREVVGGKKIDITQATVGRGSKAVRLTLATNIDCSKEYVLMVSNLTDLRTNLMVPNVAYGIVGCVQRLSLVAFDGQFNFLPTFQGGPLPTNWYTTNYQVDANWGQGTAPFYYEQGCFSNCYGIFGSACATNGTPVSVGWPTICFRTEFIIPSNAPTVGQLRLQHVIDDGAIFYVNGKELLRYNMTNAAVDFNYLAPCINSQCQTQSYTLDNLLIGTNIFCVEVHSCDEFVQADFMFGCDLDIIVTNFPTKIPELKITRIINPRRIILGWQPSGWQLQTSTNIANTSSWLNVATANTNAMGFTNSNPIVDRQRFYRLRRP
ncbi:MAG TPA: immunoglobulin domain-containing protein, partial [Candidatus Binatia bacterium]|nr:immunoglobulin domain-containing protein [Candidatus Binatia bacterium]